MKIIFLFTLILTITLFSIESDASFFCDVCSAKQILTLTNEDLEERVIQRIEPVFPVGCRCKGKIIAYLTVNKDGKVEKVTTSKGNPLLRASVIKAVREWTFESIEKNGKKVCFSGQITFSF